MVECWGLIAPHRLEFFVGPASLEEDDDGTEPLRTDVSKKSILNRAGGNFILEMIGGGSGGVSSSMPTS